MEGDILYCSNGPQWPLNEKEDEKYIVINYYFEKYLTLSIYIL